MSPMLIYVLGPSGAGKDSVLEWLKAHLPPDAGVHFARRCITRVAHPGAEQHEPMTREAFAAARDAGSFGLCWSANGLDYGVRHAGVAGPTRHRLGVRDWLTCLPAASHSPFPRAGGVACHCVPGGVAGTPGGTRARERSRHPGATGARTTFERPAGTTVLEIHNNARLQDAGHQLELALGFLPGWSARAQKSLR